MQVDIYIFAGAQNIEWKPTVIDDETSPSIRRKGLPIRCVIRIERRSDSPGMRSFA